MDVNILTQHKLYSLELPHNDYCVSHTENGTYLAIGGLNGQLASFNAKTGRLTFEAQTSPVHSLTFLHNELYVACAHDNACCIYDQNGSIIHRIHDFRSARHVTFLPYHFLLPISGVSPTLLYIDTSTGRKVSSLCTASGPSYCMAQNRMNAIIGLGHGRGTVTLWSPAVEKPLVRLLSQNGTVSSIVQSETVLVTGGRDGRVCVWDQRTFKQRNVLRVKGPVNSLALSNNVLSIAHGSTVSVFDDCQVLRERVEVESRVRSISFCPFEDILTIGHMDGVKNVLVQGTAVEYDSYEADPFETKGQRREREVKRLLEKIPYDMIKL